MKIDYTVTLADFRATQDLHARQTFGRRASRLFWFWILPGISLVALTWMLISDITSERRFSQNPPVTFLPPIVFSLLPLIYRRLVRKKFDQWFPSSKRSFSLDIDDERLISTIEGVSESKFAWSAIIEFAQDEKVTMLYWAKGRFLFFPTSILTPSQRAEFNDLVARHVVKK